MYNYLKSWNVYIRMHADSYIIYQWHAVSYLHHIIVMQQNLGRTGLGLAGPWLWLSRFWETFDNTRQAHSMTENILTLPSFFVVPYITWKSPLKSKCKSKQVHEKTINNLTLNSIYTAELVSDVNIYLLIKSFIIWASCLYSKLSIFVRHAVINFSMPSHW